MKLFIQCLALACAAFIGSSVSYVTLSMIRAEHEPKSYVCRPPSDQGEKLVVTVIERDGVLEEHCSYHTTMGKRTSRNLKDWRQYL
jgi:hypothetical protein